MNIHFYINIIISKSILNLFDNIHNKKHKVYLYYNYLCIYIMDNINTHMPLTYRKYIENKLFTMYVGDEHKSIFTI